MLVVTAQLAGGILEEDPSTSYKLHDANECPDKYLGCQLHRIKIKWKATTSSLSEAISSDDVRRKFNIYHPVATRATIRNEEQGEKLIEELDKKFGNS